MMKKVFALLLVAALTACFAVVAFAADYTDVVSLMPTDKSKVTQVDGKTDVTFEGGKLTLAMAQDSDPKWPSVEVTEAAGKVIDLTATPYLHLSVTIPEGQGEVGANGVITYTTEDGVEGQFQLSALRYPDVDPAAPGTDFPDSGNVNPATDDYRVTTDVTLNVADWLKARTDIQNPGKITIKKFTLSIYVGNATWDKIAFAKEGAGNTPSESASESTPATSATPSASAPATSTTPSASAPANSSQGPTTGDSGILLFTVVGVVAVCGLAVAVKSRH